MKIFDIEKIEDLILSYSINNKEYIESLLEFGSDSSWFQSKIKGKIFSIIVDLLKSDNVLLTKEVLLDKFRSEYILKHGDDYNLKDIKQKVLKDLTDIEIYFDTLKQIEIDENTFPHVKKSFKEYHIGLTLQKSVENISDLVKSRNCSKALELLKASLHNLDNIDNKRSIEIGDWYSDTDEQIADIENRFKNPEIATGIKTGFKNLDEKFGGFEKGTLSIIAGLVSAGKTSFARDVSCKCFENEKNVLIVSIEEKKDAWFRKLNARDILISHDKMRRGLITEEELEKIKDRIKNRFSKSNNKYRFLGLPAVQYTIEEIINLIDKTFVDNFDIIFIDYLALIKLENPLSERRDVELGYICKKLCAYAKRKQCATVLIAQVNRSAIRIVKGKRIVDINQENIEDSQKVSQDAENILAVLQDDDDNNKAWIKIIKQREGIKDISIPLRFAKHVYKFEDFDNVDAETVVLNNYDEDDDKDDKNIVKNDIFDFESDNKDDIQDMNDDFFIANMEIDEQFKDMKLEKGKTYTVGEDNITSTDDLNSLIDKELE